MSLTANELRDRFGFLRAGEPDLLMQLARRLPEYPVIVNIGAGAGTSALAFLEARLDARVITVDVQEAGVGSLEGEENALREAGCWDDPRYAQVLGDSAQAGASWKEPVDMVFVDGDHSYSSVVRDIDAWLPHIKPGGIIAFHDSAEGWEGVIAAIRDNRNRFGEEIARFELVTAFQV